jgi:small subunit ribosomal protein S4
MGDPKFLRRRYETPKHPWEAARMDEERKLLVKYGLKNKRELWKAQSILRGFRRQARELAARRRAGEEQAELETKGLIDRLTRLGILSPGSATLDDVLALTLEGVLSRRLEWLVLARGFAPTARGARQMIVHGHLVVGDHKVTRPGYLVRRDEEPLLAYAGTSPLASDDHPVRVALREKASATESPTPPAAPGV